MLFYNVMRVCSYYLALGIYLIGRRVTAIHPRMPLLWCLGHTTRKSNERLLCHSVTKGEPPFSMSVADAEDSMELQKPPLVQIAPMLDVTYLEFRYFMRLLTKRAQLWTEMIPDSTANIAKPEVRNHMMESHPREHPIVLQLGGSNIETLREAAKVGCSYGYDEINLNVGCPSEKVSGRGGFGASLMYNATLVRDIIKDLRENLPMPVTVKHRLGVDHQDSYEFLHNFVSTVAESGCTHFIVHARKAWLRGVNPKKNRTVPPLDYDRVYKLKEDFPQLKFTINGGFKTLQQVKEALDKGIYGVMIGRMAYENPCELARVDTDIYGDPSNPETCKTRRRLLEAYADFVDENTHRNDITKVFALVKPILGTFHGIEGNKVFRHSLSDMNVYKELNYHKGKTKPAQFIHRAIDIMASVNREALDSTLH